MQNKGLNTEGFYLYRDKPEDSTPVEDSGKGRISNVLSTNIAYKRTPDLFDTEEIKNRDKYLEEMEKLRETDAMLCIDRRNKPVVLTSYQDRIVHALSYAISQEAEVSKDVKEKIKDPSRGGNKITRVLNVTHLTSLIFESTRKRYKDIIIKELFNLARIRQVQTLGNVRITAPLIMIDRTIEDLSADKQSNLDAIEIVFGSAFFYGLNNRYAVITPKLFEVWRKKGRGTELFNVLLSSILAVYWSYKKAANDTEERMKKDKNNKRYTKKEMEEAVRVARRNAMIYELNVSYIKERVTTDYDSERVYKAKFWKDLTNAIEGFKELGLIEDAKVQKGAKNQEKVLFILSDSYSTETNEDEPKLLENEPITNEGEVAAF